VKSDVYVKKAEVSPVAAFTSPRYVKEEFLQKDAEIRDLRTNVRS